MQHRGEIIEKAVRESGFPIAELARRMKKSRRTLYNMFENPYIPIEEVLQIGKIIHYDFSDLFTDMSKTANMVEEPNAHYGDSSNYWKDKYIALLEKYNALLEKVKEV
jgi:lambda repressor-like predicted transcriptional regulator